MKKLLIPTIVASLGLALTSQAALVVHWPLDEASGPTAADSSGNGHDGVWQGSVGTPDWQPAGGVAGGAFNFTGANIDSFITSTFASSPSTPHTISLWMKTTSTQNDGLAYLGNGASGNQYYVLRVQGNLALANARNTAEVQTPGTTLVNDDAWHHVVAVYASDTDRKIYVDGVLEGTNTTLVNPVTINRFGIGALTRNTPHNPADLYTGMIDDVQLYDQALDQSQIDFLQANPGVAVPEPSAAVLLALAFSACFIRRRP